jgi:hypothetical protein
MPIIRTYGCPECNHVMDVVLDSSQWDDPPPSCPRCDEREQSMQQQFKPVAIGGSNRSKAVAIAQDIAATDYGVADIQTRTKEGIAPKVRYKDERPHQPASQWAGPTSTTLNLGREALETAVAIGRETRLKYGSGLDVLHGALAAGTQPDLIANSKKNAIKVW